MTLNIRKLTRTTINKLNKINPKLVAFIYGILFLFIVIMNYTDQFFCQPVDWALYCLLLFTLFFLSYPFFHQFRTYKLFALFFHGIGLWILLYGFLFMLSFGILNFFAFITFGILFMGIGLIPYFIVLFTITSYKRIKREISQKAERIAFFSGLLVPLVVTIIFSILIQTVKNDLRQTETTNDIITLKTNYSPIKVYVLERLMGMHFIYHTKLTLYDGWRPPLHDPLINLSNLFRYDNGFPHELNNEKTDLTTQRDVYKVLFPENDMGINCHCSRHHIMNKTYFLLGKPME